MQAFLAKSGGRKKGLLGCHSGCQRALKLPSLHRSPSLGTNTLLTRPIRFSLSDIVSTDVYDGGHRLNVMKDRWSIKDSPQAIEMPTSQTREVGHPQLFRG